MEFVLYEERARKAYEALLKYLSICQRSEKECRDKLYEKGYHKNEVEFAIEKAKGYRYIDDAEYVRNYVYFNKSKIGIKKLAYKLTNEKGVDKALVDNAILDGVDDDFERETCKAFAQKYVSQKHLQDARDAKKLSAYLYQKGFEWSVINGVVQGIFDVDEYVFED